MKQNRAQQICFLSIVSYIGVVVGVMSGHFFFSLPGWIYSLTLILATIPLAWSYRLTVREKQDVLENQVAERTEELDRALRLAETASQSKSDFLANMSHELRTPLNAILGFSGAMQHEAFGPLPNPTYREYAARIYKSGEHLLALINDILDLSKIEANKQTLRSEWTDMQRVLDDTLQIVSGYPEADQRRITPPSGLPRLLVDEKLVRQAFLNLLSNAIKFTKPQGNIAIECDTSPTGEAVITVADDGIGIPADKIATIAHPFTQVENVMTRSHKGSGLGLSLVDRIMKLHGGKMKITSEAGKGTRVALIFPPMRMETGSDIVIA